MWDCTVGLVEVQPVCVCDVYCLPGDSSKLARTARSTPGERASVVAVEARDEGLRPSRWCLTS